MTPPVNVNKVNKVNTAGEPEVAGRGAGVEESLGFENFEAGGYLRRLGDGLAHTTVLRARELYGPAD